MALRKTVNTDFGIQADYIKIGCLVFEYPTNQLQVTLLVYANQAARQANAKPLGSNNIVFSGTDFLPNATRADIYPKIKLLPDFVGAQDILD